MKEQEELHSIFSPGESGALTGRARALVESAVKGTVAPPFEAAWMSRPCVGVFVTLKRETQLRACMGHVDEEKPVPLGIALERAARGAATRDPRFPKIEAGEPARLTVEVSVLHDLQRIEAPGAARASAVKVGEHGLLLRQPRGRALLLPQVAKEQGWDADTFLEALCRKAGLVPGAWTDPAADVFTFRGWIARSEPDDHPAVPLSPEPSPTVRRPAVAGRFYPGTETEIEAQLEAFSGSGTEEGVPSPCRALLLPHAGWIFCGEIIAKTVAQVEIPDRLVIIGPKHTRFGPNWSVSGDAAWELPGGVVPVDTEGVSFLAERVSGLEIEREAHRQEHGVEVLLPFLRRSNPSIRIVPIAIGAADPESLRPLAAALADWRKQARDTLGRPPLLVISSDMNHFADDEETRRRDRLALERLGAADPFGLFKTCLTNDISMCGLRPAVAVLQALNLERTAQVEITAYDTSATASGDTNRVVGYAGAVFR